MRAACLPWIRICAADIEVMLRFSKGQLSRCHGYRCLAIAVINLAVPGVQLSTQRRANELLKMYENHHYPIYRVRYNSPCCRPVRARAFMMYRLEMGRDWKFIVRRRTLLYYSIRYAYAWPRRTGSIYSADIVLHNKNVLAPDSAKCSIKIDCFGYFMLII